MQWKGILGADLKKQSKNETIQKFYLGQEEGRNITGFLLVQIIFLKIV